MVTLVDGCGRWSCYVMVVQRLEREIMVGGCREENGRREEMKKRKEKKRGRRTEERRRIGEERWVDY